jgi:hypothetical protein
MKTPYYWLCILLGSLSVPAQAQVGPGATPATGPDAPPAPAATEAAAPYSIVERGANHRVWAKSTPETNFLGKIMRECSQEITKGTEKTALFALLPPVQNTTLHVLNTTLTHVIRYNPAS